MTELAPLAQQWQPKAITLSLPCPKHVLEAAGQELYAKAIQDPNQCYGYFPALGADKGIDVALPACQRLALVLPQLILDGRAFAFSFARLSLIQQPSIAPFHVDSDSASALGGSKHAIEQVSVWRLLLNVHDRQPRTLTYLDATVEEVPLEVTQGYIHCPEQISRELRVLSVSIPPRMGALVHGVLFCASKVLHAGKDDEHGHFVLGYGAQDT